MGTDRWPLQVAACTYRIAFGPRAGLKVLTVQGVMSRDAARDQELCADQQENSAACDGTLRCRRAPAAGAALPDHHPPALANERVQINAAGQVVLKRKTAWRDGTTHIVMSPLEFMQRLAALVPRPRLHLIRFHGVLAPDAKLSALVVTRAPEQATGESEVPATESGCTHGLTARISWARFRIPGPPRRRAAIPAYLPVTDTQSGHVKS